MGETSEQIERHIEQKQSELGSDLNELEQRVKRAFNWRAQVDEHPMACLAVAFAGGMVLSVALSGRGRHRRASESSVEPWGDVPVSPARARRSTRQKAHAIDAWDDIKDALVGVAATKLVGFLDRTLPGFQGEFQKAARSRPAWSSFDSSGGGYDEAPDVEPTKPN